MSPWYFIAFLLLTFSINECRELLTRPTAPRACKLPPFAHEIVLRILNRPSSYLYSDEGNADEYIDRLFTGLKEYLASNYEPFKKFNVSPEVKKIYLEGLSTIVRLGSVTVRSDGDYMYIIANLGFHKFKGRAVIEKQLWWLFWFNGVADIDVRGIEFYFKLRGHLSDFKLNFYLEKLDIRDWGKMETTLQGSNWIGSMAGFITNLFPSICTNWIKNNIPSMLYNGLNDALKHVEVPLLDYLVDGGFPMNFK